ncbi:histidine phosphatase family protein [Tropicimonas sp. IMCC6043]|uniref:histidine phosphatase family protein n=1 Tax=Tropicimonas sp. IMCC6043 TaxID=2510645 RepID=UPI0013ED15E9|nr:histidine phosphatase family protein [Tropicimonas sp. IMCC6043]
MFILRHGETVWNVLGRMQGGLDSPLTERGRAQAVRQGEILRAAGAASLPVYCSPQGRALETAKLALPEVRPITDARLAEVAMGDWQGLGYDDILRAAPDAGANPGSFLWKFSAPRGERLEEMQARVASFLAAVPAASIVVTHGVTSQLLRGAILGLSIEETDLLDDRQGVVYRAREGRVDMLER